MAAIDSPSSIAEPDSARVTRDYRPLRPGPGRSRGSVAADQRGRVEAAMVDLVGNEGYDSVTVRRLIALAHVSTRAFYALFNGIDDCLLRVHETQLERICRRVAQHRDRRLDREAQADAAIRVLCAALAEDPAATRLVLTEVFAGGPAALGPARAVEARLQLALRASLDRRGDRVSDTCAAWIVAGILHWARTNLDVDPPSPGVDRIEDMTRWGRRVLSKADGSFPNQAPRASLSSSSTRLSFVSASDPEEDLLLRATATLARAHGYSKLTPSAISAEAGLTSAAFRRHFDDIESIFLALVGSISASLFGLEQTAVAPRSKQTVVDPADRLIATICDKIAADGNAARLVLDGVVDAGRRGLTYKSGLVAHVAASWSTRFLSVGRPVAETPTCEAAVAGLWAALTANIATAGVGSVPRTALTFTRLFELSTWPAGNPRTS